MTAPTLDVVELHDAADTLPPEVAAILSDVDDPSKVRRPPVDWTRVNRPSFILPTTRQHVARVLRVHPDSLTRTETGYRLPRPRTARRFAA